MKITAVLFATIMHYHPQGKGNEPFTVELPDGSTVGDLIEHLGIKEGEAKQVFIGHRSRSFDHPLEDGDRVAIFPPVAGG